MIRPVILTATLALGAVGCVTLTPVGPITTQSLGPPPGAPRTPAPGVSVSSPQDVVSGPVIQPAQPPAPPVTDVTPGEVNEQNTAEIIRRLQAELEADRAAAEAMPRPSAVSVLK